MKIVHLFSIAALFAVPLALASCGSTGSAKGSIAVDRPDGSRIEAVFEVDVNGDKTVDVSGAPVCIEMSFTGADGGDLGSVIIEIPESAQVPAGAVRWAAKIVPCPQSVTAGGGSMMRELLAQGPSPAGQRQAIAPVGTLWEFFGGSFLPDAQGATNVSYSFGIRATSLSEAEARRDAVLVAGIGAPVGSGLEVWFYSESVAEFDQFGLPLGVRTRQALVGDDFLTHSLVVNGALVADLVTLTNTQHHAAGNDWNVVESFVPLAAFETGRSYDNKAEVVWTTVASSRAWSVTQRVEN